MNFPKPLWSAAVAFFTSGPMSRIRFVALLLALLVLRPLAAGDRMIATSRTFFTDFDGETTVERFQAGDFTADGHQDVLIAAEGAVKVYPGSGTGLFGNAIATSIAGYRILGVADLNKDGRPDLFLTDNEYSYLLGVMLGNANGTFGTISTTTTTVEIMSATAADFDGDTHLDLAVAGTYPYRILGFFGNGNGTFSAPTESPEFTSHVMLVKAASGDVNGDGKVDAVFASIGGTVRVYFSDGARGFTAGPVMHRSFDSTPLVVADLDNDGKADVVTSRSSSDASAEVSFSSGSTFGSHQELPVRDMYDAAAADLDGDGISELLLGSGSNIAVLKRGGPASLGRPRLFRVGRRAHKLAVADFDGDQKPDVMTLQAGWTYPSVSFSLTRGNGDGTLLAAPAIDIQTDVRDTFREDHDLGIADVNGDSLPDLITATDSGSVVQGHSGYTLAVFLARAEGGYAAPVFTVVPHNIYEEHRSVFAGDLNADGKPEVIVNSSAGYPDPVRWTVMSVNADGTFTTLATWNDTAGVMRLIDATGDGKIDVLDGAGYIRPGNGTPTFGPKLPAPVDLSDGVPYFVDLNNDGRLDRLGSWGNQLHARLANADGSFSAVINSYGVGISALGDLNGDGFPDIISEPSYSPAFVQLGNGNGSFGTPFNGLKSPATRDFATDAIGSPAATSEGLSLGAHNTFDFDADGHLDAFVLDTIYYGDGTGHFTDVVSVPAENVGRTFLHDVTGDGKPEIVLREMFGATAFIRVGVPRGTIAPTVIITPSVNPSEHGQSVTITARVAASNMIPNGPLWLSIGASTTRVAMVDGTATLNKSLLRGTTTISASFHGDDHIAAGSASYDHVATQAPTTTTIRTFSTTFQVGQPISIGATVATAHMPSIHSTSVVLKKGATTLGTIPTGSSFRTFTDPSIFPIGTHTLTAEFPGNDDFAASTSVPVTITITKVLPTINLSVPTSPLTVGQNATFTATFPHHSGVTGLVTFKVGDQIVGSAAVAGNTAQLTATMTQSGFQFPVVATYSGNEQYGSTEATATMTIYQGGMSAVPQIRAKVRPNGDGTWAVDLTISALSGATQYEIYRSSDGSPFTLWRTHQAYEQWAWFGPDTVPSGVKVRLYKVMARDSSGNASPMSLPAIAMLRTFTDDPLIAGMTVKAAHINELQGAIGALRAAAGLPPVAFTMVNRGWPIRLEDMTTLRQALIEARTALGLSTSFTDTPVGGQPFKARHLQEVRDAMR